MSSGITDRKKTQIDETNPLDDTQYNDSHFISKSIIYDFENEGY